MKGDQMGIRAAYPTPRELPLSNRTRFKYGLADPALLKLADIVRGADTDRLDLAPPASGLFAISLGLSANIQDAHEMLRFGMVMYDALYAWLANLQTETHN